jgi:hypothetical protein
MDHVLYAEDGDEVVGISIWDAAEPCHRYRDSDMEVAPSMASASAMV